MTYALNLPSAHLRAAIGPAALRRPLLSRVAMSLLAALRRVQDRHRMRRAARGMLALSDATLRDIGVSRWEIVAAIRFGRPVPRRGR